MKRAILDRQKEVLARQIEESGLIERCEQVALLGKFTRIKERDSSTHVRWKYSQGGISISYESGRFSMGDGFELIVESDDQEVFHVVDKSIYRDDGLREPFILVDRSPTFSDTRVLTYSSGDWEQKLDEALEEISDVEVDRYREQFDMKF